MTFQRFISVIVLLIIFCRYGPGFSHAQSFTELNSGWKCKNIKSLNAPGSEISLLSFPTNDWLPATVPGTVLTTLLNNQLVPDPFYGMNNESIPDIFDSGNLYYTYWFINDFEEEIPSNYEQVWIHLRGVNYSCEVYLNGHRLNQDLHQGMFLRQTYNVTTWLSREGKNRLAVIVYPPDPPGNPNGGQGGDGVIGRLQRAAQDTGGPPRLARGVLDLVLELLGGNEPRATEGEEHTAGVHGTDEIGDMVVEEVRRISRED